MVKDSVRLIGIDRVIDNLGIVSDKTIDKAEGVAKKTAASMENDAKSGRKWTDRTGNARRSITGSFESKTGAIIIALAIGVEYGPPLELGHGGRYAIIRPTVDEYRKKYLQQYKGIL